MSEHCIIDEKTNSNDVEDPQSGNSEQDLSFENHILAVINPIGRFQIRVMLWAVLADIPSGLSTMFFIFAAFNPGFTCVNEEANFTDTYNLDFDNVCHVNGTGCERFVFDDRAYTTLISEVRLANQVDSQIKKEHFSQCNRRLEALYSRVDASF